MSSPEEVPPVAAGRTLLAIGDPNGIGPEIALKAAAHFDEHESGDRAGEVGSPVLVGDGSVVLPLARAYGLTLRDHSPGARAVPGVIDLVDTGSLDPGARRPGAVSAQAGAAAIAYVTEAVRLAQGGGYRAVVAGPHSETAVHAAGIAFRGYPPLIARLTGVPEDRVFLLLVGGGLRIVHATLHESLADALGRLTPDLVVAAAEALLGTLPRLGVRAPHVGVFGVNPHAGESGLFGDDDERITAPAVDTLRARGARVDGPAGADVMISTPGYDAYVAMYHDQGHIPVKLRAGRTASALAVGAGIPFSSVGHGTGFDIAGTDRADPAALINTLRLFHPNRRTADS